MTVRYSKQTFKMSRHDTYLFDISNEQLVNIGWLLAHLGKSLNSNRHMTGLITDDINRAIIKG